MKLTLERAKQLMDESGNLDLRDTRVTSLPEGLTIGGSLDLRGTTVASLLEGLVVSRSLYLCNTNITVLSG